MRSVAAALLLAPVLALSSACGVGSGTTAGPLPTTTSPGPQGTPGSTPDQDPGTTPGTPDTRPDTRPGTSACDEVVAGIDAFNLGDYQGTVDHFVDAVPLAEAEAAAAPSRRTADLLEAVRYYARLAPEDYLEASSTSPEFARYQVITLGQCASGEPGPDPGGDPGGGISA